MKVKVKKFLFLGSKTAHEAFFERAQRIGWFEFISVSGQKPHHLPKPIEDLKLAIKILKKQQVKEVQTEAEEYRAPCIAEQVLYAKSELERLTEARRLLQAEMVKIHPLGEFDLNEIALLEKETHRVFQFVFTRHDRLTRDEIPKDLIFIKREFDFDYYLYIGVERFFHQAFTEVFVRTSLSKIVQEHKEIDQALHEKERQLRELTTYQQFLEEFFLREMSRLDLTFAKGDVDYYLEEGIFGIEAWVPENKLQAIPMIIEGLPIHVSEVVIETEDVVPTYLENRGLSRVGQDLVEIYDTPSITDKDPSTWILIAFSLFFGMIISDAGYGLIFLCASLYGWWRFPGLKGVKRRMLTLATCLASSSLIWGVLIASYFGLRFDPESPLYKVSILHQLALHKVGYHMQHQDATYYEWVKEYPAIADAKTPMAVMYAGVRHGEYTFMNELSEGLFVEVAILVGLLHLSLSFLRNVYRDWSGIGWTVTLWGGVSIFPNRGRSCLSCSVPAMSPRVMLIVCPNSKIIPPNSPPPTSAAISLNVEAMTMLASPSA